MPRLRAASALAVVCCITAIFGANNASASSPQGPPSSLPCVAEKQISAHEVPVPGMPGEQATEYQYEDPEGDVTTQRRPANGVTLDPLSMSPGDA
jgi:hypothetical protein